MMFVLHFISNSQVDEIVYAKWDHTTYWYLTQVLSIKTTSSSHKYNLYFMDGYSKDLVSDKKVRKVPARQRNDPMIGKVFYDPGDYEPGVRTTSDFKKGEFVVLCKQRGPIYCCERHTFGQEKRDIQEFNIQYVRKMVDKYDKE